MENAQRQPANTMQPIKLEGQSEYTHADAQRDYTIQHAKAKQLGLNYRQETFARIVATSPKANAYDAYKQAGYEVTNEQSAWAASSRLLSEVKVNDYIDYLRSYSHAPNLLSRTRKRQFLAAVVDHHHHGIGDERLSQCNPLLAIKIDNEMTGDNEPIKVSHEVSLQGVWSKIQPTKGLPNEGETIDLEEPLFD